MSGNSNPGKQSRNSTNHPWEADWYPQEQPAPSSPTSTATEEDKQAETEQEKHIRLKQHLQTIARQPRQRKERVCQQCKKTYYSIRSDSRYCSVTCRVKAFRRTIHRRLNHA